MNSKEFDISVEKQFNRCLALLGVKNSEYTSSDIDRLSHFKRAAVITHTSPKNALSGMLAKHLISICDMCAGDNLYPIEKWNEKITDAMNYLLLLNALIEEENNNESY